MYSLKPMTYISLQVFSLWCVSPASNGGLSYTTDDVGNILAISGMWLQDYHRNVRIYDQKVDKVSNSSSGTLNFLMLVRLKKRFP